MRQPLGQHFLRDPKVVQTILAAANLRPDDDALEIGPGKGALTGDLLERVRHLTVIELDRSLGPRLQNRFKNPARFRLIQGDFLKTDLDALFPEGRLKVLGNLPYSITSPIFEKLLQWPRWDTGVFLIQREVAERMSSLPGSRIYGILSLAVQLFAEVELIAAVKPGAFIPPPAVTSMVIRLKRKTSIAIAPELLSPFFDLVHGAFAHRRKTIANSLALHADFEREKVADWLRSHDIDPIRRAETLGLKEYAEMAEAWAILRRKTDLT